MAEKNIDLNELLPVKIATSTVQRLMEEEGVDDKVKAQVALAVLEMAMEVQKAVNPANQTSKPMVGNNPFMEKQIEDAKFTDVQG